MSVLERDGMDRQLHRAKTELFAEQRRAREKLESIQEVSIFRTFMTITNHININMLKPTKTHTILNNMES